MPWLFGLSVSVVPEPVLRVACSVLDDLVVWVVPAVSRGQSQVCGVFDDRTEDRIDAKDDNEALEDGRDASRLLRHEPRATTNKAHDKVQSRVAAEGVGIL